MNSISIEADYEQDYSDIRIEALPWPRFWSRLFDLLIYILPLSFLIGYFFPNFVMHSAFQDGGGSLLLSIVILPFALVIDAIVVSLLGNSLGRWLIGIKVATSQFEQLDFWTALQRNLQIYVKGLALGIPLISLIVYSSNYSKIKNGEQTAWDRDLDTRVYDVSSNLTRTLVVATVYLVLNIGLNVYDRIATQQSSQPEPLASDPAQPGTDPIATQLKELAADVKPQQLDDITKLEGAEASGRIFTYRNSISRRDASDEQIIKYLNETMVPNVCKDEGMRSDMDNYGITYRYQYSLPNKAEPLSVDVTSNLCRQIESE